MLKTSTFLIATALATLFAAPALAQSLSYVGNAPTLGLGEVGVIRFHEACNDTFPGSQFCTTEDIIRGGASPAIPDDEVAWVHPIVVAVEDTSGQLVLYSGIIDTKLNGTVACDGWKDGSSSVFGMTIMSNDGNFSLDFCDNPNKISCCKQKGGQKGK